MIKIRIFWKFRSIVVCALLLMKPLQYNIKNSAIKKKKEPKKKYLNLAITNDCKLRTLFLFFEYRDSIMIFHSLLITKQRIIAECVLEIPVHLFHF